MQSDGQTPLQSRTRKNAGIWLSLVFALALHILFLLAPVIRQLPVVSAPKATIELQLTRIDPSPPFSEPQPARKPESQPPDRDPETQPGLEAESPVIVHEEPAAIEAIASQPPLATTNLVARKPPPDIDAMSEAEKRQLTNSILSRQYFTEESAVDQLFGKPLSQQSPESGSEFHYPSRPNMIAMLDKPLPEAPFAYTPDLVYFAYDPGVKGDLQRFWDVITPEFGWRTKYGTEVRCKLVLVIIGCGWK